MDGGTGIDPVGFEGGSIIDPIGRASAFASEEKKTRTPRKGMP